VGRDLQAPLAGVLAKARGPAWVDPLSSHTDFTIVRSTPHSRAILKLWVWDIIRILINSELITMGFYKILNKCFISFIE
jgi:hypothetical protein